LDERIEAVARTIYERLLSNPNDPNHRRWELAEASDKDFARREAAILVDAINDSSYGSVR
jgi:hypothetical protein